MNLDPATTAVIAVHLQPDIVSADGAFGEFFAAEAKARNIVGVTNSLLEDARAAGAAVVFTRVAFAAGYSNLFVNSPLLGMVAQTQCLLEENPSSQILSEITVDDSDVVVVHQRAGGFSNSVLELVLRSRGVDTLVFIGVATNMSVEGTARQASDMGYRTIVVADACSAADDIAHSSSLASLGLLAEVVTVADVREALRVPAAAPAPAD